MDWKDKLQVAKLSSTEGVDLVLSSAISIYRKKPLQEGENLNVMIKKLINANETSFLEHVSVTFSIKGITCVGLSHLVRHRMASYSVESRRFVKGFGDYSLPTPDLDVFENGHAANEIKTHVENSYKLYHSLINNYKWTKSYARMVLPQCETRDALCTMNLRSIRNFLSLRLPRKAQEEIRFIAWKMLLITHELQPATVSDFYEQYGGLYGPNSSERDTLE